MGSVERSSRLDPDHWKKEKIDAIQAKLNRQERTNGIILVLLILVCLVALGLLVSHIMDVPALAHRR